MEQCHGDSKKQLPILILSILKNFTDENRTLTQHEIAVLLKHEYDVVADRKTIKSNLMTLIECGEKCGYSIQYNTKSRFVNGEETDIYTDIYYDHKITGGELRFVADSISSFRSVSAKQRDSLIGSIASADGKQSKLKNLCTLFKDAPSNSSLFLNLEMLDEAIEKHRSVTFIYNEYGTDGKLHPKRERRYAINPYRLAVANGKYYLICNTIGMKGISHFRIDKMTDVVITDKKSFEVEKIDLPKHMAEHIYMFSGKGEHVRFSVRKDKISDVIDWFGGGVKFTDDSEDYVVANVIVNPQAMKYWAMQYAEYVCVISPPALVKDIGEALDNAAKKYKLNDEE